MQGIILAIPYMFVLPNYLISIITYEISSYTTNFYSSIGQSLSLNL